MPSRNFPRHVRRILCALLLAVCAANFALATSIPLTVLDPSGSKANENAAYGAGAAAFQEATAHLAAKDYDGAIDAFTRAILNGYQPQVAHAERATAFAWKKNNDQALADCDSAIQVDPKFGFAYVIRGSIYYAKHDYAHAIADDSEAIRLNPGNTMAYYERGLNYSEAGDFDKAIADFDHVLAASSGNDAAAGPREDTSSRYTMTISESNGMRTNYYRGCAYLRKKDFAHADADLTAAIQADDKNVDAYAKRGMARLREGQRDAALADFSKAEALEPKNGGVLSDLALAEWQISDFANAITALEKAIDLQPGLGGPYNDLAWMLATCPDAKFRDGKRALDLATTACNFSSWKDPVMLDTFAAACAEAGDFDAAVKWEQNAIAAPGMSASDLADAKKRIALYQAHKTYQDVPKPVK